ncbi:hypothetical protein LOTGIDRAFT_159594 [Lottia gigantea]|uniref:Uncharacterized protein n=1 Tax=Lottia gigantea TaxID=225164 RepID=V4AIN1_LOTGI|nr:hypothetical protein LOTGIDRAFT_159594 [Lottia gigantea]ESO96847.1 hypothetical protein LOTGIDRAFT_159594 [Lottia gigantea]
MFKVAAPVQLPNLNGYKQNGSTNNRDEDELKIPNISSFYRSPYNGRVKCKKTPNHPSIITDSNRKELPVVSNVSCDSDSVQLTKSETTCTGSTAYTGSTDGGSDSHSDISSNNSSGLRGILSNREKKSKKKTEKRVKFHEQLEDIREVKDISCRPFKIKPHPLSVKIKENNLFNKLSLRGTASETDIFRKRKHQYDVDRQTHSFSDIGSISIETTSPGSYSSGSTYSENSKQMKSLFKSPMRHSYQQQYPRSEAYRKRDPYSPKQDKRCPPVAFREPVNKRSESVLSMYSPKFLHDSNGQQFVVCRLAIPDHDDFLSSYKNENILRVKPGLKPVLPEELATINTNATNFCNRDKSSRIMRWLDSVDDVHTKEGRYAELFESVFHTHRTG